MRAPTDIRTSLVWRQTAAVAAVVLLTSGLVGSAAYMTSRATVQAQVDARLSTVAAHRAAMIESWVGQQQERVALVASRTRFRQYLADNLAGLVVGDPFVTGAEGILEDARASTAGFLAISATDPEGLVVLSTRPGERGRSLADNADFLSGRVRLHIGDPWFEGDAVRVNLAAPAHDASGALLGVVLVELDGARLQTLVKQPSGMGETGQMLVARQGEAGLHYLLRPRDAAAALPAMALAIAGQHGQGETTHGGRPVLAAWHPIAYQSPEIARWGMVVRIDREEAYAPVQRLARRLLAILAGLLVLGPLLAFFAARRLTRPILRVAEAADRLAAGDLDVRVGLAQTDEVGQLARAFDSMAAELATMKRSLEAQVAERTAELEASVAEVGAVNTQLEQVVVEVEYARDAAVEANAAKSRFLANMSHELRTPLNAVIGFSELILEDDVSPPTAEHAEFISHIVESGHHLLSLINDILDLARVEAGRIQLRPELVELEDIVQATAERVRAGADEKGIRLETFVSPMSDPVLVDPLRLRQILFNFLSNALKFTPRGGAVSVRSALTGRGMFRIDVTDTGSGVAAEDLTRIFLEFEQTAQGRAPEHRGTGLGLALTKSLAEAMGGEVAATSEVGVGSTFSVVLPCRPTSSTSGSAPQIRTAPILLVDRDTSELAEIAAAVRERGLVVVTAATASDALHHVGRTAFAAIGISLSPQHRAEWEILRRVRAEATNRDTPIIVFADDGVVTSERAQWIHDSFAKPVAPEVLIQSLARAGVRSHTGARVMVVDDHPAALSLLEARLLGGGYAPICCGSGEAALEVLQTSPPAAIILDLIMPGMSGFDFLQELEVVPEYAEIPVIIWTSKDLNSDDEYFLQGRSDAVVLKGTGTASLVDALTAALAAHKGQKA